MEIISFGVTDVGCRRDKNEDFYLINKTSDLYIVADGMGGHLGGEFASRLAVTTIDEVITEILHDPDMTLQADLQIQPGDYRGYLQYAIEVASNRVFERAIHDPSLHGMGTTVVALMFKDGKAIYANVGDSRCYLFRDDNLVQLTQDHSLVNEQLQAGVITFSDVKRHKLKNIITRSVGFQEGVDIDINVRPVKAGDKYLLCTDGLTNMVGNDVILEIVKGSRSKEACLKLVELANKNGGEDNITVVIAETASVDKTNPFDEETEGL